MTLHATRSHAPLVLLASGDAWSARALETVLQPAGYRVRRVATGALAEEQARSARPDVVLIATPLPDRDGVDLCRALRQDPGLPPGLPVIGVTSAAVTREQRLSWLRAGAWDYFGFPLDPEELLLKVDGYLRAQPGADAGGEDVLVDRATGLYNGRGLKRRARELVAEAVRAHAPLACVVFGPDPGPEDRPTRGRAARAAVQERVGGVLRTHARLSDTVGWWTGSDFAVLAPATDANGAEQLARRLANAIEVAPPAPGVPVPPLDVRVGYYAVANVHATPVDPEQLLEGASTALALARSGERGARIRRFEVGR